MMHVCEWCGAEYPGTIGAAIIGNEYAFICPGCEDKWRCEQIPIGRDNAISREALAARWRMPDRMARRTIARLRAEPIDARYAILSTSRAPHGYWRSDTEGTLGAGAKNNRRVGGEKMNLNKWVKRCHEIAVAHGWRDEEKSLGECIALMHSENGGLKK